jgi:hypothetical protein
MNHRVAWTLCLVSLALGLGIGGGGVYWMTRRSSNENPTNPVSRPEEKQGDRAIIPDPGEPASPQLQRSTLLVNDVLRAGRIRSAQSFTLRGVDAAYYWVFETNSYRNGSSYVQSGKGLIRDGGRITVATMHGRVPGEGIPGSVSTYWSRPGGSGEEHKPFVLPQRDFVGAGMTSEWALSKAVDARIGQAATLCQFGCVDDRTGRTDETPLRPLEDPHGEFKPLPRIRDGENHADRLTVRLLFMARKGDHLDFPKEPEEFVDVASFLKRAAAEQK